MNKVVNIGPKRALNDISWDWHTDHQPDHQLFDKSSSDEKDVYEFDREYKFSRDGELMIPAWGPRLVQTKVEQKLVDLLLEKGKESREKNLDYRHKLAGQIENEYYFEEVEEWFVPEFSIYMDAYIKNTNNHMPKSFLGKKLPLNITLTGMWINYQQAKEYNPPHNHNGDLSFVIFLQVPDEIKKENKEMEGVHNNPGPGMIHFDYPGVQLPLCATSFVTLPGVGDLFMFPSWLTHYVPSFKSDVERISVSGNIDLENSKEYVKLYGMG